MLLKPAGFSLIELLVAMAIMSILIAMGLPAFNTYLANTKVRASAESLLAGLQTAKGDAVRRNAAVEFLLTNDPAIAGSAVAATESISGTNWIVRLLPTVDDTSFIEGKQATEGGTGQVNINATAGSIVFNGFGGANPGATFDLTHPADNCAAAGGSIRCLRVELSTGGRIHMCDPAVTAAQKLAGDTRGCD